MKMCGYSAIKVKRFPAAFLAGIINLVNYFVVQRGKE
jgi:hypothetical protein